MEVLELQLLRHLILLELRELHLQHKASEDNPQFIFYLKMLDCIESQLESYKINCSGYGGYN